MTKQIIRKFDRGQWLAAKDLLVRTTIFLDLRFWIGMSEERERSYVELKSVLSKGIADRRIICPISPSLLLELKKRPNDEKRTKYCQLMDELSQGLSIRNWLAIFGDEFKAIIEGRQIEPPIAYSHFVEAFSAAGMQLVFEEPWSSADADRASSLIFEDIDKMQIGEILAMDVDENQEGSIKFLRNGLSQLAQRDHSWRQNHSDSSSTIEKAEFAATVQAVLPQILSSLAEINPIAFQRLQTTSIDERTGLLKQCPTFWCRYQLMTELRLNREKLTENDLWDMEHAASALPYVDSFACDGGTRHLCSEVLRLDDKYDTAIMSKTDDLIEWIKAHLAT